MAETKDKYGIKKLYETKSEGRKFFNKWDNGIERSLEEGDDDPYDSRVMYTCGQPDVELFIDGRGVAYNRGRTSSTRIFVSGPWTNTEMTVFVKPRYELWDISLRSRSNHEQTCGFGNYVVKWVRTEDADNPTDINEVSVEVEPLHPFYKRHLDEKEIRRIPMNKWMGYKQVTRTIEDDDSVKVEGWVNLSGDRVTWKKHAEYIITDSNISGIVVQPTDERTIECTGQGDEIPPDYNANCLFLNPGQWCWVRLDGDNKSALKYLSVREIDPL